MSASDTDLDKYAPPDDGSRSEQNPTLKVFTRMWDEKGSGQQRVTLEINREDALTGRLSVREALLIFSSAEGGAFFSERNCKPANPAEKPVEHAQACALTQLYNIYRDLEGDVSNLQITADQNERETVREFLTPYMQLGLLNSRTLIAMAEIGYSIDAQEELARIATVERSDRLARLGFAVGFAETIHSFYNRKDDTRVQFPQIDDNLPEDRQWEDLQKRIEESGFVLDAQGRVSGFRVSDTETVEIPEKDRGPQIHFKWGT